LLVGEYCNSPEGSTTFAELRAQSGSPQPYNVQYWGVGNESWGCGGNFTAEEYAVEFRRYSAWLPGYGRHFLSSPQVPMTTFASWTRGFLEEIVRKGRGELRNIYGLAFHHYAWNLSAAKPTIGTKEKAMPYSSIPSIGTSYSAKATTSNPWSKAIGK